MKFFYFGAIFAFSKLSSAAVTCNGNDGKTCYFVPNSCSSNTNLCNFALSYRSLSNGIEFELETKVDSPSSGQYIAVGLSNDDKMGDDSVMGCIQAAGESSPTVSISYNAPGQKNNQPIEDSQGALTVVNAKSQDGTIYCKFQRSFSSSNPQIFPVDKAYTLLLARGPPAGRNQLEYHSSREALGGKVDLRRASEGGQQLQSGGGSWLPEKTIKALVKSHGIMMIFGWWLFIDVAVLFARYFKAMWPNSQPCNLKIWFHFHRGLNITGLILVVAAFVCIFVSTKGVWVGNDSEYHRIHAICGITCVIGGLMQPIMALFRCKPDAKYRPIFNWLHRFLGVSSWCLASVTIWWATNFPSVGISKDYDHKSTPRALMIILWAGLGATLIALEVHITATERIGISDRVGPSRDLAMERLDHTAPGQRSRRKAVYNKSWPIVRCVILGLFVCLAIAITVTLAYWIGIRSQ